MSKSPTRPALAVVHKDEDGTIALSTPDGIVALTPVEARQLAVDLTSACGSQKPRPGLTWPGVVLGGLAPVIFSAAFGVVAVTIYGILLALGLA